MTLIASFELEGVPVILGDLLLSAPARVKQFVRLPATNFIHIPASESDRPKTLCQKIAIISDNVAVAWAGKRDVTAQDLISDLRFMAGTERLNSRLVNEHFDRQRETVWEAASVVGFVKDDDADRLHMLCRPEQLVDLPLVGKAGIHGTGAHALISLLSRTEPEIRSMKGERDRVRQIKARALALAGGLLHEEIVDRRNLPAFYGGGYELATMGPNGFEKIDDVTYIYWRAVVRDNLEHEFPSVPYRIIHFRYLNDLLAIRVLDNSDERHPTDYYLLVPPIYRKLAPDERFDKLDFDFNGKHLCHTVMMHSESTRKFDVVSAIEYQPHPHPATSGCWITAEMTGYTVAMQPDVREMINSLISDYLRANWNVEALKRLVPEQKQLDTIDEQIKEIDKKAAQAKADNEKAFEADSKMYQLTLEKLNTERRLLMKQRMEQLKRVEAARKAMDDVTPKK